MTIIGRYDEHGAGLVTVDGVPLDAAPSQALWNHSPCGFAWGYGGSGPAQLALAILLAAGLDDQHAVRLHQRFKWAYISPLPQHLSFAIDVNVRAWADGQTGRVV